MNFIEYFKNRYPFLLPEDFEAFENISTKISLKKGQKVFKQGTLDKKIAITLKGIIRGYLTNYKAKESTTFLLPEFHAFAAYEPLLLNEPARQIFECLEPSDLFILNYQDLKYLAKKNERVNKVMNKIIMDILLKAMKRNESFITQSPKQRYLSFMESHSDLMQRVSQKHIASFLGITAVSFSRLKKRIYKE